MELYILLLKIVVLSITTGVVLSIAIVIIIFLPLISIVKIVLSLKSKSKK